MVRRGVQGRQQFRRLFFGDWQARRIDHERPEEVEASGYNDGVEVALREFRREDFESLWRIDQQCFTPGIAYSRMELAAYIRLRNSFTLIAEARQGPGHDQLESRHNILGFIVAQAKRGGMGHILTIDVLPSSQRLGVGSRLLTAAEDRLRAAPWARVVLETAVDNSGALAFYKRHDYNVVETRPRYYANGVDALVLEKAL